MDCRRDGSNLQITKHTLIQNLYDRGKIDKESYEDYSSNYALLMRKPSFFSNVWSNLAGKRPGEDCIRFILVRQETINESLMKLEKNEKA